MNKLYALTSGLFFVAGSMNIGNAINAHIDSSETHSVIEANNLENQRDAYLGAGILLLVSSGCSAYSSSLTDRKPRDN